jgi:hypothetical protein
MELSMEHSTLQNPETKMRIRGRIFTAEELSKIKVIVESSPAEHRFEISKRVCKDVIDHPKTYFFEHLSELTPTTSSTPKA